jgi:hypothetical protein
MIMNRIFGRRLTFALFAALLLSALPRPAAAAVCGLVVDTDPANGLPRMTFNGPAARQNLVLQAEATQTTVSLDCNGNGTFTDAGELNAVVYAQAINTYNVALGGTDNVTFNIPSSWNGVSKNLHVFLLGGPNNVSITTAGSPTITNSKLLVNVYGYLTSDTVNLTTPAMDNSKIVLRGDLSFGNDTVNVTLGGPVTNGSSIDVDTTLDLGGNTFNFTQPAGSDITNSTVSVYAEGGANTDNVTTNFKGVTGAGGRLNFTADLGAYTDHYRGNLDLATFQIAAGGEVHVDVDGAADTDDLTFTRNGTTIAGGAPISGLLDVRLNGGLGLDALIVDLGSNALQLNGGTLALRANGGASNDVLTFDIAADASSTDPHFDVAVFGGMQTDKITWNLVNGGPNTAANYGPAGAVLIQGGAQIDTCKIGLTNNSIFKKRDCEFN